MQPLISVVLPVYKPQPDFFRECIESVLSQSHPNFELVISDDSPAQHAEELLRQFGDERIRYFKNPGKKGIFQNLNHAIRQSKGEFVQIFCQDDRMYSQLLAEQLRVLEKFPQAGFAYAQSDIIDEAGKIIAPCKYPGTAEQRDILIPRQKAFNSFFRYGCLPGNLSTVMLRRSLIDEVGYFNEEFPFGGDFKYWADAIEWHEFAIVLPPMVAVRSHNHQASRVLGAVQWTQDAVPVYRQLYKRVHTGRSRLLSLLFINESFGVQSFYGILVAAWKKRQPALLKKLLLLNEHPFKLWLIVALFVLTLKNRLRIFQLKSVQLFAI